MKESMELMSNMMKSPIFQEYIADPEKSRQMILTNPMLKSMMAGMPGMEELIETQLGIKTIICNPFSNMTLSNKVNIEALNNDAPSLMIACGLAMRSFG